MMKKSGKRFLILLMIQKDSEGQNDSALLDLNTTFIMTAGEGTHIAKCTHICFPSNCLNIFKEFNFSSQ